MKTITAPALLLACSIVTCTAAACDFDVDCEPGSVCRGNVCVGGLWPGNDNDDRPLRRRDRPEPSYGDTCTSDFDCDFGMVCARSRYVVDGACVPAR